MHALVAKDLRLATDAFRPWAVGVLGTLVGLLLVSRVPASLMPLAIEISVGDGLLGISVLVAYAAFPFAAVAAAIVVQGDGRHGAGALAAAMPIGSAGRVCSKLGVLGLVALACPVAAALGTGISLLLIDHQALHTPFVTLPPIALFASLIGAGYGLIATQCVQGRLATLAISLLLAGVAAGVGWLGGSLVNGFLWGIFDQAELYGASSTMTSAYEQARLAAAVAALVMGAILYGAVSIACLAEPRSRRWRSAAIAVVIGASLVTGALTPRLFYSFDPSLQHSIAYQRAVLERSSQSSLAEAISQIPVGALSRHAGRGTLTAQHAAVFEVASGRVRRLDATALATDPVALALRRHELFSDADVASDTLRDVVPPNDPRRLRLALDAAIRFPDSIGLRERILFDPQVVHRWKMPEAGVAGGDPFRRYITGTLRDVLEVMVAEGHPESDRMRQVLQLMGEPD